MIAQLRLSLEVARLCYSIPVEHDGRVPMPQIVIEVGKQSDGATFMLSPWTQVLLEERALAPFPATAVFLSFDTSKAFEDPNGPWWDPVAFLLTGLTRQQLREFGGFSIVDPVEHEVLYESLAA
jgi:hypothetical protein